MNPLKGSGGQTNILLTNVFVCVRVCVSTTTLYRLQLYSTTKRKNKKVNKKLMRNKDMTLF